MSSNEATNRIHITDGGNTVASVRAHGALQDAPGMVAAFSREFFGDNLLFDPLLVATAASVQHDQLIEEGQL